MRFLDNIPIYVQIMEDIKKNIITGKIHEGEKLPSIREYCVYYQVTSLTMQRVINELEREGVLRVEKGKGSFLIKDVPKKLRIDISRGKTKNYITDMLDIGFQNQEILKMIKEELNNGNN